VVAYIVVSRRSPPDPASARCNHPPVSFGPKRVSVSHQEVDVRFTCAGAAIAGTIALPKGRRPHPAVVWVHGSGRSERLRYKGTPMIHAMVAAGVAVLSYDKRGVGESGGACCPGDKGHFNLMAADAVGAVNALRSRPEIDRAHIGLIGGSQAGWIIPLAAARSSHEVAFIALVDAPVVSFGEEELYSDKTGDSGPLGKVERAVITVGGLRHPGPSGFNPQAPLRQLTIPGIWLYGGQDQSQPTADDLKVLARLKAQGKNFTVVVYPQAGHGLLDFPPTDPRALPAVVQWIRDHVQSPTS
jgi:uncharacterized protein